LFINARKNQINWVKKHRQNLLSPPLASLVFESKSPAGELRSNNPRKFD